MRISAQLLSIFGWAATSTTDALKAPALSFTFLSDQCVNFSFSNDATSYMPSSLQLVRNSNVTICEPSMGIRNLPLDEVDSKTSLPVESSFEMSNLLVETNQIKMGITIELWLKSNAIPLDGNFQPILTIGQRSSQKGETERGFSVCDTDYIDFNVGQRGSFLELSYRTIDQIFYPCQTIVLEGFPLTPGELVHIVVSLQDQQQQVFVNGRPSISVSRPFSNDLSNWNSSYFLSLLPYSYSEASLWLGVVYKLAFYASALTFQDASASLQFGLPASPPFSLNYNVIINEDSEVIAGSHAPEWYSHQPSLQDASQFQLFVGSMDREVHKLQLKANVTDTNPLAPILVYITSIPLLGRLFQADGSPIEAGKGEKVFFQLNGSAPNLMYLPPFNANSRRGEIFSSFSYCVTMWPIFDAKQCNHSLVSIIVLPVNDPPLPVSAEEIAIEETVYLDQTPKIHLSGYDIDDDDIISKVQITLPPRFGSLVMSVSSFRRDGILNGVQVADLGNQVSAMDPVYVQYNWIPNKFGDVVRGDGAVDSFRFRIADKEGVFSMEKSVKIYMLPGIVASFDRAVSIPDDSLNTTLKWFGNDISGYNRTLGFYIESAPPSNEAALVVESTGQILQSGLILKSQGSGVELVVVPSRTFCNGSLSALTEVTFRLVAFSPFSPSLIAAASEPSTQRILIECPAEALSYSMLAETIQLAKYDLHQAANDPCRGTIYRPSAGSQSICNDEIVEHSMQLLSADHQERKATVDVFTATGSTYMSFNIIEWKKAEAIVGRRAMTKNTTFLAFPGDLPAILSDLQVQSYSTALDQVSVVIKYGNCSSEILNSDCQVITQSILVETTDSAEKTERRLSYNFPWQVLLCLFGYPLLYYTLLQLAAGCFDEDEEATVCANDDHFDLPMASWIEHRTEDGDFYYENITTGIVTWMAPVGEEFIEWEEPTS